eukprot:m.121958 g.121958  ORF g.121958 m.121958 type:complete len:207 (+) comp9385_c2_seq4:66-686(+)
MEARELKKGKFVTGCCTSSYSNYDGETARIASVLTPLDDKNLRLAAQIGITDVVYYDMDTMPSTVNELVAIRERCASFGLRLSCVEGGPPMNEIVQGRDKKKVDEQIDHFNKCIRAMGKANIPILCSHKKFAQHICICTLYHFAVLQSYLQFFSLILLLRLQLHALEFSCWKNFILCSHSWGCVVKRVEMGRFRRHSSYRRGRNNS